MLFSYKLTKNIAEPEDRTHDRPHARRSRIRPRYRVQEKDIWKMSLWTSNMTPPQWTFLSFLYRFREEVAIELSIFVSWIATTWGWWKSRKASNSYFAPLMLLIFMLINFNPLMKLILFARLQTDHKLMTYLSSLLLEEHFHFPSSHVH